MYEINKKKKIKLIKIIIKIHISLKKNNNNIK